MKKFTLLMMVFTILFSCNDDDTSIKKIDDKGGSSTPIGEYINGLILSNEGQFKVLGTASVDFLDINGNMKRNIFKKVNPKEEIGDQLQSIGIDKDYVYLVASNSNKITVVERFTFKKVGEITSNIEQPRYLTVEDNKVFVTNSINFSKQDGYISVFKRGSWDFLKRISFYRKPEKIYSFKNKLFVQQSAFGKGDNFVILDANTYKKTDSIQLTSGLRNSSIKGQYLYAISTNEKGANVFKINMENNFLAKSWSTNEIKAKNNYSSSYIGVKNNGTILWILDENIYSIEDNEILINTNKKLSLDEKASIYGFNVFNDNIYVSKANFTGDSTLEIYSAKNFGLLKSYNTGIGLNGIYVN